MKETEYLKFKESEKGFPVKTKCFKDKRTGEIVTQFNILDIGYMQEIEG